MQAVDWSSRSLFKRIQSRNYPKGGPGEAPGLPPAIMVNEIRAKDEAGSLWKRVKVCTEAWAVCACMPACIYSSSFLMSSQDPNSGGKAEAPVFFSCIGLVLVYAPRAGISTCRTTGTMSVGPGLKSVICVAEAALGTIESRLALVVVPLPWLCLCLFRRHSSSEGVLLGASGGLCALCAWNP